MEILDRFIITELPDKAALDLAHSLETKGPIELRNDYCYLKLDDRFIHLIQPLLTNYGDIEKPDYFIPPEPVGAHVSIIYPEEGVRPLHIYSGQMHDFSICGLVKVNYKLMEFYALSVVAPSLAAFREMHHLGPKPTFKGQEIMFHITVGVKFKTSKRR